VILKRRLVWNVLFNGLNIAWRLGINFLLLPFLVRSLGREAYGVWVLVASFSVVSGYLSLLDLGFLTSIAKFVAEHRARQQDLEINQVVSTALVVFSVLGTLASAGLALFAALFLEVVFNIPPDLVGAARALLYALALQVLFEFPGLVFWAVLEGLQRYDLIRLVDMVRMGIYALLLLLLLPRGYGLAAMGIISLIVAAFRILVFVVVSRRLLPMLRLKWRLDWSICRRILTFSSQVFVLRINTVIYQQIGYGVIAVFLISTLLTDYDVANRIQNLMLSFLIMTGSIMVPAASKLNAIQGEEQLQDLFVRGTKYVVALCLPIVIFCLVFTEAIIRYWIGPDYVHDVGITRLYLVYLFYFSVTVVGYNMMIGMDRIRPLIKVQITATVVNLLVSVILVRPLGVAGVIWGALIGHALLVYPYLHHSLSTLRVPWSRFWQESLRSTLLTAVVFALLLYIVVQINPIKSLIGLAAVGAGGLAVYGGMFFRFGLSYGERCALTAAVWSRLSSGR